jgi:glutathione S-transferase
LAQFAVALRFERASTEASAGVAASCLVIGREHVLTVHHLGKSQSERIVWLCEELAIPYALKVYDRDSRTMLAPAEYRALHPIGAAPVVTDGDVVLAESNAIVDYIITVHGGGRLAVAPGAANYADYLYWLHFVNGTLQPAFGRNMVMARGGIAPDAPIVRMMTERVGRALGFLEARLGEALYLAGEELTAADIMIVFTLTTMRYFMPFDLSPYPNILAYLQRIGERPAYRTAMEKGDPGMKLLLD